MKKGMSLVDLAKEIERQQSSKRDFIVPVQQMDMGLETGEIRFTTESGTQVYPFNRHAHGQLADKLGIPRTYFFKMLDDAVSIGTHSLVATNVNHWLRKSDMKPRMIRTLDGIGRAVLSNKYRTLDYADMMEATLPILYEQPEMKIVSCQVTETKLYLKALFPRIEGEVKKGDFVQAGLVISNSEVGSGSVAVQPLLYRLVCDNGMIMNDSSMRKYHVGRVQGVEGDVMELLSDETKRVTDKGFWMAVQDVVRNSLDSIVFEDHINRLREAAGIKIESSKIEKVVEVTAKKFRFSDEVRGSILKNLIEGSDLSQWGLANAVTRTASDVEDYELATELERAGGRVIELSKNEWSSISRAA